jgi:hypothetical protein
VNGDLRELTRVECVERIVSHSVGRVGTSIGALPAVLPVNYVTYDGDVYFRTAPGTKLTNAVIGAVVAFEVDQIDPATESGWSVILVGRAFEVTDPVLLDEIGRLGLRPWAAGQRDHVVVVRSEHISGRELLPPEVVATVAD